MRTSTTEETLFVWTLRLSIYPQDFRERCNKDWWHNFPLGTVPSPHTQGHEAALPLSSPPFPCSTRVAELGHHPPPTTPQGKRLQQNRSWAPLSVHMELPAQLSEKCLHIRHQVLLPWTTQNQPHYLHQNTNYKLGSSRLGSISQEIWKA